MLIAIEGLDHTGKTTCISYLKEKLNIKGKLLEFTKEPGGTEFGKELKEILLLNKKYSLSPYTEALLFAADRIEHIKDISNRQFYKDSIFFLDRYVYSFIAYQAGLRKIPLEFLLQISVKLIIPTFVLYFYTKKNNEENIRLQDDKITSSINKTSLTDISCMYWFSFFRIKQLETIVYSIPALSFSEEEEFELINTILLSHI